MLHILFNEKSDSNNYIDLSINKLCIIAFVRANNVKLINDPDRPVTGKDIIEEIRPYNSYIMVDNFGGKVKNYRKMNQSMYRFLDMNRLGVAIRMDFFDMYNMFATHDILQIDTGMITKDCKERDIIIRIFEGTKENFHISSDLDYDIGTFNSNDLVNGPHPRRSLWDYYGLRILPKDIVYKSDDKGRIADGNPRPIILVSNLSDDTKYLEFEIIKYKGRFEKELTRDIDNEEVFIESTSGLVNTRRVKLVNGKGKFRLYPLGYSGEFKIKLGRKWYEVWNEYSLKLEDI